MFGNPERGSDVGAPGGRPRWIWRTGSGHRGLPPAAPTGVILLLCLLVFSCAKPSEPAPNPRLVLLYAACTVNANHLSPYTELAADQPIITPRLADFASRSVVFERHMTESGQSGPAYASIFTGRHADGHGVFHHPTPIDPEIPILGQVFRDAGFYVEAWLAHVMASAELGYGRGADAAHDLMLTADTPEFVQILDRLSADPEAKALVIAQQTLTHAPYRVESLGPFCTRHPAECALRADDPQRFDAAAGFYLNHHAELSRDFPDVASRFELRDEQIDYLAQVIEVLYRANVARLDHHFGTLLDAIEARGLSDESLVAFTADHGEADHGTDSSGAEILFPWTHGHQLSADVLRVPWIVSGPGLEAGRFEDVSRSTDLLPTMASLSGIAPPALPDEPWNGRDLSSYLRGQPPEPGLEAYSHTAMTAEVILEESQSWEWFRRWFPREDPGLMWTQIRSPLGGQDSIVQLRGRLDGDSDVKLEPVFLGAEAADDETRDAVLQRLRVYRQRLIEAWNTRSPRAGELEDERQKELLRRLGYIE